MAHIDIETLQLHAAGALSKAQRAFKKDPSAGNWTYCLRAMLTHQQAVQLGKPGRGAELDKAIDYCSRVDAQFWDEGIVRGATGRSIGDLLPV